MWSMGFEGDCSRVAKHDYTDHKTTSTVDTSICTYATMPRYLFGVYNNDTSNNITSGLHKA